MSSLKKFGVQSYCFRKFLDNADVARKARLIGVEHIEVCRVHADFADAEAWKQTVQTYKDEGVSIVSLGVETLVGDPSERALFEAVAAAGAKHLSVHFQIDSFGKAIAQARGLAREYGIRVGIHCHGGYMFGGAPDILDHLLALGAPEIGVCIDTAWCMQIGPDRGNPVEWAKRYAGNITGIHFKDFVFEKNGQWKDTVVGQGNLDLPAFVAALTENGFDGMSVIEYEADPDNPVPALTECVAQMRKLSQLQR